MRIIICGAGKVGTDIAKYLMEEDNEITLIDINQAIISRINDTMDVRAICGYSSYPNILEEAGAQGADMIIAVTSFDEINMVACQVANAIFNIPKKIARISSFEYLKQEWSDLYTADNMPIDVIISPEIEMAKAIERSLCAPGAMEVAPLVDEKVYLLSVRCRENSPVIDSKLEDFPSVSPDILMSVVGILREGNFIIPDEDEVIKEGDEVYLLVDSKHILKALSAFGCEEEAVKHIAIFGAGRASEYLASQLMQKKLVDSITIIEKDSALASEVAAKLEDVKVINGDFLETEILEEAGIRKIDAGIALTEESEANILGSLLVKRYGVKRTFTFADKPAYSHLVPELGIDIVLDPKVATISSIIQYLRRGCVHSSYVIKGGLAEVMEVEISEHADFIGKSISDMDLPKGAMLGAVMRDDNFLVPNKEMLLETGDKLLFFVSHSTVKVIEEMFSPSIDLF